MKHSEIRRTFLAFYAERGHTIVPSASLIPRDDPTLLFTSAGMVQFKPLFAGTVPLPYRRATGIQKCLRGSDLPEVGVSFRHLTFFEMLGNFSFGDYFKKEGIAYAWEYLTEVARLDQERLVVTVLEDDREAWEAWRNHIALPENRIIKLGAKDNFWGPAGGIGACGPCSEIYYDLGAERGCGQPTCGPGCDCPRFMEVYNVVFPQFDQQSDGTRRPLANRGIDTGMGMERLALASQGASTVFETDLFTPLLRALGTILDLEISDANRKFLTAAADHARALTFAIADGAIPSNEARGYMLRSILRRALLLAHRAGIHQPFLYRLSSEVVELMRPWYPELAPKRESAALIIKSEEERFLNTLNDGMARWLNVAEQYRATGIVPGDEVFKLHDTFGFHVELTRELAIDAGLTLDMEGFERAMQVQRDRSRKETFLSEGLELRTTEVRPDDQRFCGYELDETETELVHLSPLENGEFEAILEHVPFYAESGGQVGDTGEIAGDDFTLEVLSTYYVHLLRVCKVRVTAGTPKNNVRVRARVNQRRRREIERAHTATHLLHAALRRTVGDYVKQEGSLVEPGRLRFDFTCFQPMTPEQIAQIEAIVYDRVIEDIPVQALRDTPIEEARTMGALAFFGENYGARVNVIRVGDFSMEFCGGTHLQRTGQIGLFRIVSEAGIAAGIRRIEALVGEQAFAQVTGTRRVVTELSEMLGVTEPLLSQKVTDLTRTQKNLESRVERLSRNLANALARDLLVEAPQAADVKVLTASYEFFELADLRLLADAIRQSRKEKVLGLLVAGAEPQIRFLVFVSPDLESRSPAGKLAREVGKALGGGGGGKPDVAEGGGKRENIPAGFEVFRSLAAGA